jgi:3-isopropylmalate/(R)-2-methylmalate dehydratase small subunit
MEGTGEAMRVVSGPAVILERENIDTDVIINIKRCVTLKRGEYGPWALEALRYRADGSPDPACPLNGPPGDHAVVLVTGANFGCGSSRELAVWALRERGIQVVVAPSFGDIFFGNCFENFVLPIRLEASEHARLTRALRVDPQVTVDLDRCRIDAFELSLPFHVEALRRQMLLSGQRTIDMLMARLPEVRDFERRLAIERPWLAAEIDLDACCVEGSS